MIASPDAKTFARTRSIDFGQQGEEGTGGGGGGRKKSRARCKGNVMKGVEPDDLSGASIF